MPNTQHSQIEDSLSSRRTLLIPVDDIGQVLTSVKMCNPLLVFHAITGCDSTSSLAGIGKKKAREGFCRSSLSLFGEG